MGRLQNNPSIGWGAPKIYTCLSINLGQKQNKRTWLHNVYLYGSKDWYGIQPTIGRQHKVTKFTPWNVVRILWNEFWLNMFLEEFPCVAIGLPFLLPHCLPPCGGIALQIRLGKFHGRMPTNLGGMKVIFHFRKPNIHNLLILSPIQILELSGLEPYTFGWSSLEGCYQFVEIGPIHFE